MVHGPCMTWLHCDTFPTLPSLACLRAFDNSSSRASRIPMPRPSPRRRKSPWRSWGCRALEMWAALVPMHILAHHFSRRYVSSPDSLSCRMARVRFFTSGEPDRKKDVFERLHSLQQALTVSHSDATRHLQPIIFHRVRLWEACH